MLSLLNNIHSQNRADSPQGYVGALEFESTHPLHTLFGKLSQMALVVPSFNATLHPRCSPPPPLAKESSSVGRALAPHRLAPRWLQPYIHFLNSLVCVPTQEWRNRTLVGHELLICSKMCFTKNGIGPTIRTDGTICNHFYIQIQVESILDRNICTQ